MNEDDVEIYFGLTLLGGSTAVAAREAGKGLDIGALTQVSFAHILLSALLVAGAVVYSSVRELRV